MIKTEKELISSEKAFSEMNKYFGGALRELQTNKYKLVGRFEHLHDMSVILERPDTPIGILLARAGVGKTASMQAWKREQERETGYKVHVLSLNIGTLSAQGKQILQQRLENLIPKLKEYESVVKTENPKSYVVLFIDEIHMVVSIFGAGDKVGGDLLKRSLSEDTLRVMTATTENEYNTYIASDEALERRFKPIHMKELDYEEVKEVLRDRVKVYLDQETSNTISDNVLDKIVLANKLYRSQFAEPAKSIDVLETMVAYHKVDGVPLDSELVNKVFKTQYNIDLNAESNVEHVAKTIIKRVKGQALAVFTIIRMVKAMVFRLEENNKAMCALLSGSTGSGKTELAKALAEAILGDEKNLFIINMPDFQADNSEPQFRRTLGQHVSHHPTSVILMDEIEKANGDVQNALLPILDEGVVTYTEKAFDGYEVRRTVSLRNCIILVTTNAGANMYDQINRYSSVNKKITQENMNKVTKDIRREWQQISPQVNKALIADKFKPEILGRFAHIIPFRALSEATLLEIAQKKIDGLIDKLYKLKKISISTKPAEDWTSRGYPYIATELAMFIVFDRGNQIDSKSGGARNINRLVDSEFMGEILDAIFEYPDTKSFVVTTNGNGSFENDKKSVGDGEIKVTPTSIYALQNGE